MPTYYDDYNNISPEEFINDCSPREIEELIDALVDDGYVIRRKGSHKKNSVPEDIFEKELNKLHGRWNMLTTEEENLIYKITNRF